MTGAAIGAPALRLAFVAAAVVLVRLAASVWARRSLARLSRRTAEDPLVADVPPGLPVIVYFSSRDCVPCRLQQQPALERLCAEAGAAVRVISVDASRRPEIADRWGVVTTPTTVVLDRSRAPRFVNRGLATFPTLSRQLGQILGRDADPAHAASIRA